MKSFLKIISLIFCIILIALIFLVLAYFLITKDAKLDMSKLSKTENVIEVYSSSGNLISTKSGGNAGGYVKINELNAHTKNAFIAIEDRRFYTHNGIDYKRILGATLNNVRSLSFKEGASTITQQLVKNTHLTSEKTLKRKLNEIKIARELEKTYDKDKILELYLNTIYFGKNAYGIEEASYTYFNKPAKELSLNESAVLAGIIKAPKTYSPIDNYENAFNRKNLVLKCMYECGFINKNEYNLNKSKQIVLNTQNLNVFTDYVNAVISEYESLDNFTPYNANKIKIQTFLDEELQRELYLNKCDIYNSSQIVINSKTHGIIAFYGDNSNMKRAPASCVKPWLVYAPMINDEYIKESSVIVDEPINYDGYSPKNYNDKYYGSVTVKTALSKSLNVPAVKLLNGYGIEKANNYTKKLGIDLTNESLSSALGALNNGLTLKELCDAYSPFNNSGKYKKSTFIKNVFVGNVSIYKNNDYEVDVFTPETCYIINDILKDAVQNGNSKKLRNLPYEICAKTGTNGNEMGNLDAISVSYTSDAIVGVWVGNNDNSLMPNTVTGSSIPTIITKSIYDNLYKSNKPPQFSKPKGIIKLNVNEDYLLKDHLELISSNGSPYYYVVGTEPTALYEDYALPQVSNCKLTAINNKITLNFTLNNVEKLRIYRISNGNKIAIYNGEPIESFTDNLTAFGKYQYVIEGENKENLIQHEFSSVNYKKENLEILKDDKWLND